MTRRPVAWSVLAFVLFVASYAAGLPAMWSGALLAIPLMMLATGRGWRVGAASLPIALLLAIAIDALTASWRGPAFYLGVAAAGAVIVGAGHALFVERLRAERWSNANERRAELLSQAASQLYLTADPPALYRELTRLLSEILEVSHTAVLIRRGEELELVATYLWDIELGYRISMDSVCGAAYRRREEVYVPDTRVDDRYVAPPNMPVTCSELAVPLIVDDEVVAVLNIEHRDPERFNAEERTTLRALTRIAEEALQRMRAVELLEQQRSQQAFLARLNHELLSAESTPEVSEIVLRELTGLLHAHGGAMFTLQGSRFEAVADFGQAPDRVRRQLRREGLPWRSKQLHESWVTQEPSFISDYQLREGGTPEVLAMGLRAIAIVPIVNSHGRTQALLAFGSFERPREWHWRERELVGIVASTLGVAFERAVLAEQMVKLLEIVRALAQTEDPGQLYAEAVAAAVRLIPGAEAGSILVRSGDLFPFAATHGFAEDILKAAPPFTEEAQRRWHGGSAEQIENGVPRLATGADVRKLSETSRRDRLDDPISFAGRMPELQANICVPITFRNEVTGVLNLDNLTHEGAFGASDLRLAEAFGQQIGVIIRQAEYRDALEHSVITDTLTGLGNREGFNRQLAAEMSRAKRYDHPLNLAVLDLDGFKAINDAFGHQVGDETLIHVAEVIGEQKREGDSAFRWGGDEFALIVPQVGMDDARRALERYARAIESIDVEGRTLSVSIGLANYPEDATESEALLRIADDRMYDDKASHTAKLEDRKPSASR